MPPASPKEFEAPKLELLGQLDSWQLSKTVLASLLEASKTKGLTIRLHNTPGKPFRIVTDPVNNVADWGVGGS